MNSRLKAQVKVPTEMAGNLRLSTVGMHDRGAMPRLDLMERPTPRATTINPSVEIPYRTNMLLVLLVLMEIRFSAVQK